MDRQLLYLGLAALPIVAWFGWDCYRWLRVASRGPHEWNGREVLPGQAASLGAAKGVAALGVIVSVVAHGVGAPDAVVVVGPLLMILVSYLAERSFRRGLRPLASPGDGEPA